MSHLNDLRLIIIFVKVRIKLIIKLRIIDRVRLVVISFRIIFLRICWVSGRWLITHVTVGAESSDSSFFIAHKSRNALVFRELRQKLLVERRGLSSTFFRTIAQPEAEVVDARAVVCSLNFLDEHVVFYGNFFAIAALSNHVKR